VHSATVQKSKHKYHISAYLTHIKLIKQDLPIAGALFIFHKLKVLRHRWDDNIKKDLQEVGWGGTDWIDLVQDRSRWPVLVNAVVNLRVP